jgi:hypothetical protein
MLNQKNLLSTPTNINSVSSCQPTFLINSFNSPLSCSTNSSSSNEDLNDYNDIEKDAIDKGSFSAHFTSIFS